MQRTPQSRSYPFAGAKRVQDLILLPRTPSPHEIGSSERPFGCFTTSGGSLRVRPAAFTARRAPPSRRPHALLGNRYAPRRGHCFPAGLRPASRPSLNCPASHGGLGQPCVQRPSREPVAAPAAGGATCSMALERPPGHGGQAAADPPARCREHRTPSHDLPQVRTVATSCKYR